MEAQLAVAMLNCKINRGKVRRYERERWREKKGERERERNTERERERERERHSKEEEEEEETVWNQCSGGISLVVCAVIIPTTTKKI